MVHLHDAPHTTDGARTILSDFVRTYQARIQQERLLAARPVTLKDHGKMLRTTVGTTLVLMLDERRAAGFEWNVTSCSGDPQLTRLPDPSESIARACFEIVWSQRGHMFLTLREECSDLSRTKGRSVQPRQFEIQIVVE